METGVAIQAFLLDRESSNVSPRTLEWYRQELGAFCTVNPELPETPDSIRLFLKDIQGADETKHAYFRSLRAFYNFIHKEYGFPLASKRKSDEANPIKKITAPRIKRKVMRSLSLEELHQLLNAPNGAREANWHLRDLAIITIIADTGIRLGEAILTWDAVNSDTINVNGKTGEREVPISPEALQLLGKLRDWNDTHFGTSQFVFLGKKGPLTPRGIQQVVRRAFMRAGLNGRRSTPHTLRHTFGRNWVAEGGDPYTLQQIFGHTTMTMVRRYVTMNTKELVKQHRRFSPVRTQARLSQSSLWDETKLAA